MLKRQPKILLRMNGKIEKIKFYLRSNNLFKELGRAPSTKPLCSIINRMKKNIDNEWKMNFLFEEFEKESDRAAVILAVSLIDEALYSLLKAYLVPINSSTDEMFEGANAPIGTFSAKINMAYRLGLISTKFARDIHLLRKIRNSFAHDVYGCNFENGSVKSRIIELNKSITSIDCTNLREHQPIKNLTIPDGERGDFLVLCGFLLTVLHNKISEIKCLEAHPNEEIYGELFLFDGETKEFLKAKAINSSKENKDAKK